MPIKPWIDLRDENDQRVASLTPVHREKINKMVIYLTHYQDATSDQIAALKALKFRRIKTTSPAGHQLLATDAFAAEPKPGGEVNKKLAFSSDKLQLLRQAFPGLKVNIDMDYESEVMNLDYGSPLIEAEKALNEKQQRTADEIQASTNDLTYLGLNQNGDKVFSANGGARYIDKLDSKMEAVDPNRKQSAVNGLLISGLTTGERYTALAGLQEELKTDPGFNSDSVTRYIDALALEDNPETPESAKQALRRLAQESVSSALLTTPYSSLIGKNLTEYNDLKDIEGLYSRLPLPKTSKNGMHPTVAAGAFQTLTGRAPASESSLLVVTSANADLAYPALAMGFGSLRINSTSKSAFNDPRLNSDEITRSTIDTQSQTIETDSTKSLLAAYSFNKLDNAIHRNNFTYEYEHEIELVNTLNGITDDGVAVIQIPSVDAKRDRVFVNHLSSMYGIEGVAKLDSTGFESENNHLLLAVSGKRPVQDESHTFSERFSSYTSPYEAFEWLRMKGEAIRSQAELETQQVNMIDDIDRDSLSSVANQISGQNKTQIVNPLQVVYQPLSINSTLDNQVCVPSSLQRATFIAQAKLTKRLRAKGYDGVIDYLADKLKYDPDFLRNREVLEGHQLDQAAHQILLHEDEGRAMIVGSGTGTGKTRLIALFTRYHLLRDTPVYISGQNDGIFQKVINELYVLDSFDLIKPFVLNHNVKIFDQHDNEITRGANETNAAIAKRKEIPNANVIFATVGQTARGIPPMEKDESLQEYDERVETSKIGMIHRFFEETKPAYVLDESHTSGGQSKSFLASQELIKKSSSQLFLSATSIPSLHAINLYKTAFPKEMDTRQLELSIKKGGLPMAEAIVAALTEDGAYFRAELPDEKVFNLAPPGEELTKFNMDSASQLAVFFDYYTSLTGETRKALTEIVEQENIAQANDEDAYEEKSPTELGFSSSHFGSKVGHMINSAILIHNTLHVPDLIENEIKDGRKVVFTMQHTGRSFLDRMIDKNGKADSGEIELPTMQDMCLELLSDIHLIDRRVGKKIVKVDLLENMAPQQKQDFLDTLEKAKDFVMDSVSDLPFSPIDMIRDELTRREITSTEISSRQFKLVNIDTENKTAVMAPRKNNTPSAIADFHDGKADVILMTSAGSTGHDMHARKDTPDNRLVTMIYGELDNWAVTVLQTAGRVDRMNQVGKPRYMIANPGLPAVTRMIENTIKKVAFVSSSTTANAKNTMLKSPHDGEACILSEPGMKAIIQYLTFNPDLANRLYMDEEIEPYVADSDATITYNSQVNIANKFLSRLMMLNPYEALDVIEDVSKEADAILKEQRALGIDSSGGVRFLDIKGTITEKTVVQASPDPDNSDHPLLGDVVAYSVAYKEKTIPMSSEDVSSLIEVGLERMSNDKYYDGQGINKAAQSINDNYHQMMFSCLPDRARERAIAKGKTNQSIEEEVFQIVQKKNKNNRGSLVSYMHDALNWIKDNMPRMSPGGVISFTPSQSIHSVDGVIVGLNHPRPGQEHNMSQWSLDVAIPGEPQPQSISLMDIYKSRGDGGSFDIEHFSDTHMVALDFDEQVSTSENRVLNVLAGNLPKAALMLQNKSGVMSINFTDDQGNVRRGFQLPSKMSLRDLRALEQPMPSVDVAVDYLRDNPTHIITSHPNPRPNEHVTIRREDSSSFVIEVPRNKAKGGIYHSNPKPFRDPISGAIHNMTELEHITRDTWTGTRQYSYISVEDSQLPEALRFINSTLVSSDDEHLFGGAFSNEWLNKYHQAQKEETARLSALSATENNGEVIKPPSEDSVTENVDNDIDINEQNNFNVANMR